MKRKMDINKWLGWLISLSWVGSGLIAAPGKAQPPNQSDITGTNIWHNTAPIFDQEGKLNPDILNQARSLDQALEQTADQCYNSVESASPRRFARNPRNSDQACSNPNCVELNRLVQESQAFLDDLEHGQQGQGKGNRDRAW